jgi:hypothetical protein
MVVVPMRVKGGSRDEVKPEEFWVRAPRLPRGRRPSKLELNNVMPYVTIRAHFSYILSSFQATNASHSNNCHRNGHKIATAAILCACKAQSISLWPYTPPVHSISHALYGWRLSRID